MGSIIAQCLYVNFSSLQARGRTRHLGLAHNMGNFEERAHVAIRILSSIAYSCKCKHSDMGIGIADADLRCAMLTSR